MEIRKDLELVSVDYENNGQKAVLTFLDRERKQVRVVNFNKQSYRDNKYKDDPEKAAKVDEWCEKYFGTTFPKLGDEIGTKKDVYCYEKFNSLWEIEQIEAFTPDMLGTIYQTEIKEIVVDDYFIKIRYEIDGKTYESKMSYGVFMKGTREWYQDPVKKEAQYKKFQEKFQVPVEERASLVGHPLMVEVKSAFGDKYYGDVKKFPAKKS